MLNLFKPSKSKRLEKLEKSLGYNPKKSGVDLRTAFEVSKIGRRIVRYERLEKVSSTFSSLYSRYGDILIYAAAATVIGLLALRGCKDIYQKIKDGPAPQPLSVVYRTIDDNCT